MINSDFFRAVFNAGLVAVDPCQAVFNVASVVNDSLLIDGATYELAQFDRILVIGAGKATARMAQAVESLLGSRISQGLVIVKLGHCQPLSIIEQVEAAHPVPDEAGMSGTERILKTVRDADKNTLIICLLSGGASALLVSPVDGVTLQDKQHTTRLLLNAGASITELNAVRKHLSRVKGGRLALAACPAQLVTLILSDVIGDPLEVIASGPTAPDYSTFADAWAVTVKYGLQQTLPLNVLDYLRRGLAGKAAETVKITDGYWETTQNRIVASLHQALDAAKNQAIQLGVSTRIILDTLQGEAREAAVWLAQHARDELAEMQLGERRCLLVGGETTVTVRGTGKGGRNQELALAFALEMEGVCGVSLLSAGTDGSDGPTDAAGAVVDGATVTLARRLGIESAGFLENNDSYAFFHQLDALSGELHHFKPGPTGTNVMDMQIVLLNKTA